MSYECAICSNLLTEEPEFQGTSLPTSKRPRYTLEPVAGPSSGPMVPAAPEICITKCGHMFHKICLGKWIQTGKRTCPNCRRTVTELTLMPVFPNVNQEERKCQTCEITKKTCDKLQESNVDLLQKLRHEKNKVEEKQRLLDELQERHRLLIDDIEEMTKKYYSEQDGANILNGKVASLEDQIQQQQRQWNADKEQFKNLFEVELRRTSFAEMEVIKTKEQLEGKEAENKLKWDRLHGEIQEFKDNYLKEKDKSRRSFDELQEHYHILMGKMEEITEKYKAMKSKANNLEGKVASLETQLQQQPMPNDSDSDESYLDIY